MDIDFERIAMLLGIVEKQPSVSPKLTSISGAALDELSDMNEEIRAEREARTLEEKRKEDERVGKLRAEAAKQREAEEAETLKQNAKPQPKPIITDPVPLETVERKI